MPREIRQMFVPMWAMEEGLWVTEDHKKRDNNFTGNICSGAVLEDGMPLDEIIGFVAGFGTTFAAMPDLIAMLRRRSCEGMNPTMATIMGTFQIVWVYYGFLIESRPVMVWNLIAVVINFLTLGAYVYFARSNRR